MLKILKLLWRSRTLEEENTSLRRENAHLKQRICDFEEDDRIRTNCGLSECKHITCAACNNAAWRIDRHGCLVLVGCAKENPCEDFSPDRRTRLLLAKEREAKAPQTGHVIPERTTMNISTSSVIPQPNFTVPCPPQKPENA